MIAKTKLSLIASLTILLVGFVLAASTAVNISITPVTGLPTSVTPGQSYTVSVNVENSGNESLTLDWLNTSSTDLIWTNLPGTNTTISNGTIENYNVSLQIGSSFTGTETIKLKANVYNGSTPLGVIEQSYAATYTAPDFGFCEEFSGQEGDLEISAFEVNNLDGDDEEWELLNRIEVEVEVENTHRDDDVRDVLVEILILDSNNNDVTNEFDFEEEEEDLGKINEDDYELATFIIPEIPADISDGTYKIYVRAFSESDEHNQCVSESNEFNQDEYHEFDIIREEDQAVIVRNTDLDGSIITSCGDSQVPVSFSIYNIGEDKEEKVLVNLFNNDLGVNEFIVVDSLREGKSEDLTFFIDIPENLEKEKYDLQIVTYFDWDDDENDDLISSYDLNSDADLDKTFTKRIEVFSCSAPTPSISASLASEAKMGEEITIKTFVTNEGNDEEIFLFSIDDYQTWADIVSITPESSELREGETKEVTIKLLPKEPGYHELTFKTIVGGETYEQAVSLTVAEKPGAFGELDQNTIYIIIGIVILLILILIILIVRVSSRNSATEEY